MKSAYIAFWTHNGNVAFIWHAIMVIAVIAIIVCMIFYGNRNDVERDRRRSLERHRPDDEVFENFEQHRRR